MPALDRRIIIRIIGEGSYNEHDEYIDGPVRDFSVWAQRRDERVEAGIETLQGGGLLATVSAVRKYRVRWFSELAAVAISLDRVRVTDGDLANLFALAIEEAPPGTRRRFFDLTIGSEVG